MSRWRERGYVQDSDEEDDSDSIPSSPPKLEQTQPGGEFKASIGSPSKSQCLAEESSAPNLVLAAGTLFNIPSSIREATTDADDSGSELSELGNDDFDELEQNVLDRPLVRPDNVPHTNSTEFERTTRTALSPSVVIISNAPALEERSERNIIAIDDGQEREEEHDLDTRDNEATQQTYGRRFRTRNPIQLHPYLLEGERYRQTLKSRGVRPIFLTSESSTSRLNPDAVETQERDFQPLDDTPPSSPVHREWSPKENITPRNSNLHEEIGSPSYLALDDDDELPDVESLIRRRVPSGVQTGPKRRKIAHTYSRKLKLPQKANRTTPLSKTVPSLENTESDIFDIPPSPPRGDHLVSSPLKFASRVFHMPDGTIINGLPTPITSSESRPTNPRPIDSESDSDSPPRSVLKSRSRLSRHPTIVVESSSNPDSSGSESAKSDVSLKQVKRKIKGVLPASWLKLDRQAQLKRQRSTSPQRLRHQSIERSELQRGIARKVTRPPTSTARLTAPEELDSHTLTISEESDTASVAADVPPPNSPGPRSQITERNIGSTLNESMIDDVMEDNRIDYMLPSISRLRAFGTKRRKKQLTLTDSYGLSGKRLKVTASSGQNHSFSRAPSGPQHPGKKNTIPSKPRTSRPKPPRLSILDSRQTRGEMTSEIPRFIRLAARQARRQRDRGRQSPSQKAVRLQTLEDTEEANAVLHQWRAGTLKPRSQSPQSANPRHERQPLIDRDNNKQQRQLPEPLPKSTFLDAIQPTGDLRRNMGSKSVSRLRQTQLDPVSSRRTNDTVVSPFAEVRTFKAPNRRTHLPQKLFRPPPFRGAQLESLEADFDLTHRNSAFQRQLSRANLQFSNRYRFGNATSNPQLSRFLADDEASSISPSPDHESKSHQNSDELPQQPAKPRLRLSRKRPSTRIDVGAREYRQPGHPLPVHGHSQPIEIVEDGSLPLLLQGLGPFGTRYAEDFDVFPLDVGTYFHQNTFIGSGELDSCLHIDQRDLGVRVPHKTLIHLAQDVWCSAWTEEVSSAFTTKFQDLCTQLDQLIQPSVAEEAHNTAIRLLSSMSTLLRQVISYFSTSLYYLDPIDRSWSVATMVVILDQSYTALSPTQNISDSATTVPAPIVRQKARALSFLLVLAAKVVDIADDETIEEATKLRLDTLVKTISAGLISTTIRHGHEEIRTYLEDSRRRHQREAGIRDDKIYVQCIVIAMQALSCLRRPGIGFWDVVNDNLLPMISTFNQIFQFERVWSDAFMLLPFGEFDRKGVLQVGSRFVHTTENWDFVKALVNRLFLLYPETSKGHNSSLNIYIRAVLSRCCTLIDSWGWKRCEGILGAMFDFFARNKLSLLRHEDGLGSPKFLGMLAEHPSLQVQPDDRSFTVFLKCLALGLKGMQGIYPDKKMRNIVYRFIPNHGRTYRKDESIRQEDLDALRNHHDILCTLYWAAPLQCRPRLDLLRELVDHAYSHREACRLSVKAWSDLVKFQLSTDEPYESLLPFALWYKDIMKQSINQYRMARTEAETQYDSAKVRGDDILSPEVLQSTIRKNQNQVLATLRDAVAGVKNAIGYAHGENNFTSFLRDASATKNLDLFDVTNPRTIDVVIETLAVFELHAKLQKARQAEKNIPSNNEESQDYGDVPDFDEFYDITTAPNQQSDDSNPLDFIHTPLWHLLSNCFGAETSPGDTLLTKAVDTWTAVAQWQVDLGKRTWHDYVGTFSIVSWHQLRDTEQSRKFAAYFMSSILTSDPDAYKECRQEFIAAWVLSLVDRESMLKFQHILTGVLVNANPQNPLLKNLPFLRESSTGEVMITATTFRERRIALISSILANMRDCYEDTMRDNPKELVNTRNEYTTLLKDMMSAMKRNYLELQQCGAPLKGAYVEFVQTVVQFLQQYTSHICLVDRFFTDSVAFPLPTTDPTYVVGRLGSYSLKLADTRTTKQLSTFIQTVSERAAVDNQQSYLLKQLCAATASTYESGNASRPTLRHVLVQDIFPAYIGVSLKSPTGWIVASPILQALRQIYKDVFYQFSVSDEMSVESCLGMIRSTLREFYVASQLLIDHEGLLEQSHTRHVVSLVLRAITALLPLLDYIHASTGKAANIVPFVLYFRRFSIFIAQTVMSREAALTPFVDCDIPDEPAPISKLRDFCAQELDTAITNWAKVGDGYYVVRGNARKEVLVQLGTVEEEGETMLGAIEGFLVASGRTRGMGVEQGEQRREARATNLII
ncbi:hypothetical protein BU16DRAFT_506375 [Lophium mytilinum]|uniref:Mus7/MMS22 family-domain-containing protein n=1 Tax=Lophium mytilinum TaxID=390894 RepID=A0A6A6QZ75_9PEZI|nr:hypothetical protein BU16DRAFT_506375 [Lophium mytilinum]